MLGWALRLLLLFLLVRALMLIVGGLMRGLFAVPQAAGAATRPERDAAARTNGTLVMDPVCGTYVLQERALTTRTAEGATAYFCSERCRSAYDAQATRSR